MPGGFGDDDTRRAVAALAGQYGLLLDETAPLTAGDLSQGSVRVVVSRMKASVPGCPDWSKKAEYEFNSNSMSNYGCSVNSNLAAMIADPRDLIEGRDVTRGTDASPSGKAIKGYREKPLTGLQGLKSETTGNK